MNYAALKRVEILTSILAIVAAAGFSYPIFSHWDEAMHGSFSISNDEGRRSLFFWLVFVFSLMASVFIGSLKQYLMGDISSRGFWVATGVAILGITLATYMGFTAWSIWAT